MNTTPVTCPTCGKNDSSQRINSLLMNQTRYVTRQSYGSNWGNPWNRRNSWNRYPQSYTTTSVSGLAVRLTPPGRPWPAIDKYFWFSVGISAALGFITNLGRSPIWAAIWSGILGAGVGYGIVLFRNWQNIKKVWAQHQGRLVQYGESYYCSRDDICYMPGHHAASPEQFKAWLFQYQ